MVNTNEYAQLATAVYPKTSLNTIYAPQDWERLTAYDVSSVTGFTAAVFRKGSDIVISYAGTNEKWDAALDFISGNIPAASGMFSAQVLQAMQLYLQVKRDLAADITFTGHSLGGGLASLMATYFDCAATVFAPAPFLMSAAGISGTELVSKYIAVLGLMGWSDAKLNAYPLPTTSFDSRCNNVTAYTVEGEVLSLNPARSSTTIIGAGLDNTIAIGANLAAATDLHTMALHAALLRSSQFTDAVKALPGLLSIIFDKTLEAHEPQFDANPDFLHALMRLEWGIASSVLKDQALNRFASETLKLSGEEGIVAQPDIRNALFAVVVEYFLHKPAAEMTAIFNIDDGDLHFKYSDIGADRYKSLPRLATAVRAMLGTAERALAGRMTAQNAWHLQRGSQALNWTANPDDVQNDAAIGGVGVDLLSAGAGADILNGGAGGDVLTGGTGADTLLGGLGSDIYLFSNGDGRDVIADTDGEGTIRINGQQISGGKKDAPGHWLSDDSQYGFTLLGNGSGGTDLFISEGSRLDSIIVRDWHAGQLGISLSGEAAATNAIAPFPIYAGSDNDDEINIGFSSDRSSAVTYVGKGGFDILVSGSGNDQLYAGDIVDATLAIELAMATRDNPALSEFLSGNDGDDLLVGSLSDVMLGGGGKDTMIGGGGTDYFFGDSFDSGAPDTADNFWQIVVGYNEQKHKRYYYYTIDGEPDRYYGGVGFLSAYGDADTIIGGGGQDVALGEMGKDTIDLGDEDDIGIGLDDADTIFGGNGNDVIFGDFNFDPGMPNGTEEPGELAVFAGLDAHYHGNDVLDGGAGNDGIEGNGGEDALYGGSGDDFLSGDDRITPGAWHGNDELDGGSGNDNLVGGGKDDDLYGGDGDDQLSGDDRPAILGGSFHGEDYLDGGAGNDILDGGGKDDILFGGDGDDTLWGDASTTGLSGSEHGRDTLDGEAGDDTLAGGGNDDELFGGAGNDALRGDGDEPQVGAADHGADYLNGEDGDDILVGDGANDTLIGDDGDDELQGDNVMSLSGQFHGNDVLDGGAGNDRLFGDGGNDALYGGDGNDVLQGDSVRLDVGFHGNDVLDGGAGDDVLLADGGNDVLSGGDGNDQLDGGEGNDALSAGNGDDSLLGDAGNDRLDGGAGADVLFADAGDDVLDGGEGQDQLDGGEGNDVLNGAAGDDLLFGGDGDDTLDGGGGLDYLDGGRGSNVYVLGDQGASTTGVAHNTIVDGGGTGIIQFADATTSAGISISRAGDSHADFVLQYVQDSVYVENGLQKALLTGLQFSNGDVMTRADIMALAPALAIDGGSGADDMLGGRQADTLLGGAGDDVMQGSGGNDKISGGAGNDLYRFNLGDGQDQIDNSASDNASAIDTIALGSGIATGDVVFNHVASDLVINIGASERITVKNYYLSGVSDNRIDRITFADNTVWDAAAIERRIVITGATSGADTLNGFDSGDVINGLAGNDTINGNGGNDQLMGDAGTDRLYAGKGDDVLDGGSAEDELYGEDGSDTYLFGRGAGCDNVWEYSKPAGDVDTIRMAPELAPDDIMVLRITDRNGEPVNLLLYIKKPTNNSYDDAITVQGFFSYRDNTSKVEQVTFVNGTIWDVATLTAMSNIVTENGDNIFGYAWDDSLDGRGGDDYIFGYEGNDILAGGAGNDGLKGGAGNDGLLGGAGKDTLEGQQGNDTLAGGSGRDLLYGDDGDDTYVFARGDDTDIINEIYAPVASMDTLRLGAGIAPADVTLFRHGDSLAIVLNGSQDQAWVSEYFVDRIAQGKVVDSRIEKIVFEDGTVWNGSAIRAHVVAAPVNAMTGTAGNDTFVVDNTLDTVTEGLNQGIDTIQSSVELTLGENVENLSLTGVLDIFGRGNGLDNVLRGNSGNNYLNGLAGRDTLFGGAGNDTLDAEKGGDVLSGGSGDDIYIINNLSNVSSIFEAADEGNDTIRAYGGNLPDNVENMLITGAMLFEGQNFVTGNALDNFISMVGRGQTGFRLDGGAGADTMVGGVLNDTYVIDNAGDIVREESNAGRDLVQSSISTTLGANLENLELTGMAMINGTGNSFNNFITGNSSNNELDGDAGNDSLLGGFGDDTLVGGSGSDTYVFNRDEGQDQIENEARDSASAVDTLEFGTGITAASVWLQRFNDDLVVTLGWHNNVVIKKHFASDGSAAIDQIRFADRTLWNALEIEQHLQMPSLGADMLMGTPGNDSFNALAGNDSMEGFGGDDQLFGGDGEDTISGGEGNDTLDGGGGVDNLFGDLGNDTYVVDEAGDRIHERASEGLDLVLSSVSWMISDEVENLTLIGTESIAGIGNALDNVIVGNSGTNRLDGAAGDDVLTGADGMDVLYGGSGEDILDGGTGEDLLYGGVGNDVYHFSRKWGDDFIFDEDSTTGNVDAVRFDETVSPADIELIRDFRNLFLAVKGTPDLMTISSWFESDAYKIEQVDFADGTQWDVAEILARISVTAASEGNDERYGLESGETLEGMGGDDGIYGLGGNDTLSGNTGDDVLLGGVGNDVLDGGAGNDWLEGNSGNDVLAGGEGSDLYFFGLGDGQDLISDTASDNASAIDAIELSDNITMDKLKLQQIGTDLVLFAGTSDRLTVSAYYVAGANPIDELHFANGTVWNRAAIEQHLTPVTTTGADTITGNVGDDSIHGLDGNDVIAGGDGNDRLFGDAGMDTLKGDAGDDVLDGGLGADQMRGSIGNDVYVVDNAADVVLENVGEGIDTVQSAITHTLVMNIEALLLTGAAAISGTGNGSDNLVLGNSANNALNGAAGNDLLQGGAGNDNLTDTAGKNLFGGGAGNDSLVGGSDRELFIGGAGNDTITTSTGADVIAFNRGDGQDVVNASTTKDNTLSLGNGIKYADLMFRKDRNDLILVTGVNEQITFKDWYLSTANHSVAKLQIVIEPTSDYLPLSTNPLNNKKIKQFNFDGLANKFDQARVANRKLTSWGLSSSLSNFQVDGSDTAAIGGDLGYQYAMNGNLSMFSMNPALAILTSAQFGLANQNLQGVSSLQDTSPRLF